MSAPRPAATVAYLATHHPRVTATFVSDEIAGLEAGGLRVVPIAINGPDAGDLHRPGFAAEIARTRYLKQTPPSTVVKVLLRAVRAGPVAFVMLFVHSFRTAGLDVQALVWRAFHAVEVCLVWDHCRTRGVRHLHAHFAQLPSTLAWLTCEFGNRVDGARNWTFSYTVHGPFELEDQRAALVAPKVAAAAFVVGVSDLTASQLKRFSDPADWARIHVVRCGLDLDRFVARPSRPLGEPPIVTTVGRLSPEKGQLDLVEAMAILRDRGVPVTCEIIGEGPFRAAIEECIVARRLDGRVRLVGALDPAEVAQHLARSDVFCLPSFSEGLPVSIMEAMAIGVPVVATAVGGIPELVIDNETGGLVPPARPDSIADAIELLFTKPDVRERIVRDARRRVEARHDATITLGPLEAMLRRAATR